MAKSNIAIGVDPGNGWKHSILSRYQYQLEKQEKAEEAYLRAYERATMAKSHIRPDKVQGGDKKDLHDRLNDLAPLREQVSTEITESARIRIETSKIINSVGRPKYQLLLVLLYIEGLDYKDIGKRMRPARGEKMSVLHNQALALVDLKLRKEIEVKKMDEQEYDLIVDGPEEGSIVVFSGEDDLED